MPRKPRSPIQEFTSPLTNGPAFFDINAPDKVEQSSKALSSYNVIQRSSASYLGYDLSNLAPNISARPSMTRSIYDLYRPNEAVPKKYNEKLAACDAAYKNHGIVKNTIDLMSDFGCSGIRISHSRPVIQNFYRRWWNYIGGTDRSERFLSCLYKLGTVVVRMQTGRVPLKDKRNLNKALSSDVEFEKEKLGKREIPAKYTFLHPALVKNMGGPFSGFMTKERLMLEIPRNLKYQLQKLKNTDIMKSIPAEILQLIKSDKNVIELDPLKTFIFYYKKDDWETRPDPVIFPILKHLIMLDKLSLADSASLDGAISKIRIFKLGSFEYGIAPTSEAVNKLNEILEANPGGGTIDLIWGPDIELIESKSDTYQFLGEEKYRPHLDQAYVGLGIPTTLTGSGKGTTNNYISLKTLIKRLEYGRRKLKEFWYGQLKFIQDAMGFKEPAVIEFDLDDFGDEEAHKRLLIEMADRELISEELLQEKFGHETELERVRILRESKERESNKRVKKSSPYHDPQFDIALKKIALQQKLVTPKQIGLELEEDDEDTPFDKQLEVQKQKMASTGTPGKPAGNGSKKGGTAGRPSGKKDSQPRKTKTFKPAIKASIEVWADEAQTKINNILKPLILEEFGKKNMRSLSTEETNKAEHIKTCVLYNIEPLAKINQNVVISALDKPIKFDTLKQLNRLKSEVSENLDRELTFAEISKLKTLIYFNNNMEEENG